MLGIKNKVSEDVQAQRDCFGLRKLNYIFHSQNFISLNFSALSNRVLQSVKSISDGSIMQELFLSLWSFQVAKAW